ncbi:uncharacterized protein LOC130984509 [Arachis stenosperma]|uniref:uncharacterized protein LOC130984509 n=1 Tax=Arachis stenosperma TaxID=217475 RepID=UPI0025ACB823|nr:uncharacterized protein LOC130984509 [Arachis stenosperma]
MRNSINGTKPLPLPSFSTRLFPTMATPYLHSPPTANPILHHCSATSTLRNTAIPTSTTHHRVQVWWLTCFGDIWWRWFSRLVSFYLLSLNLVAAPSAYPASSTSYACEHIDAYYYPVMHLRGELLKKKLNSIVAPHHSLSYQEVWDALKILDAADIDNPEASSGIVEIYSLRVVSKRLSGKPQGWNSESTKQFVGLSMSNKEAAWTLKTDKQRWAPLQGDLLAVNSSRGNKYYGECMTSSNKCLSPANKEAALDTETDKQRWAPPARVRGDIARALMYMAVAYGFQQPGGNPGLRLSDTPNVENREMGLLSTLLKWNEVDPPSREEKLRNERICKMYQHNRNPFVDHPEYANLIWKWKPVVSRPIPFSDNDNNAISSKTSYLVSPSNKLVPHAS